MSANCQRKVSGGISIFLIIAFILSGCNIHSSKKVKVGILTLLPAMDNIVTGFKEQMNALGYEEGVNIEYLYEGPANDPANFEALAAHLIEANVDTILAVTTPGAQAAYAAARDKNIPVVFAAVTDPINAGLVKDLNQHENNITGVMAGAKDSSGEGRRLELFLQVAPGMKMIYMPFNASDPAAMQNVEAAREAAKILNVKLIEKPVTTTEEALQVTSPPDDADGIFFPSDRLIGTVIEDFLDVANQKKLPTSVNNPTGMELGALMSYGPEFTKMGNQAANQMNQILKGTPASSLPVEVPQLLLGINLKTAKLIGLEISDSTLQLAAIILR